MEYQVLFAYMKAVKKWWDDGEVELIR